MSSNASSNGRRATRRRRGSSSSAPGGRRRRWRRPVRSASAMCPALGRGRPVDASNQAASSSAVARSRAAAASPAASSAAMTRCAPRLSPSTTQAQPKPLTMSSASSGSLTAHQASAASMLARSVRANARCSAWRLLRTPSVDEAAASANQRRARRRQLGEPGPAMRIEGEGADAVEQPVATAGRRVLVDDHERATGEPADDVDRRWCRDAERVEDELDRGERCAPGKVASAHRPRWSSGNSRS